MSLLTIVQGVCREIGLEIGSKAALGAGAAGVGKLYYDEYKKRKRK